MPKTFTMAEVVARVNTTMFVASGPSVLYFTRLPVKFYDSGADNILAG